MTERNRTKTNTAHDPDNMPITQSDIETGKVKIIRRRGRPVGSNKVQKTVRLDKDVVEALQKDGNGWQTRMNMHLRKALNLVTKSEKP